MFCNWASEIGPDFWTFCCCGTAHALTIKEILSLPSKYVFKVSKFDPHPPPFLRVLLAFEWCRQMWGNGKWDNWQREWIEFYPMHMAPERSWRIFEIGRDLLKIISKILFTAKFSSLNWKSIPSLFDFKSIY